MPLRVLLAEDNEPLVHLLSKFLTAKGLEVISAPTGLAALRHLATTPVDLVLLDLRLPERSGLEVLQRLRRSPRGANLPVIIMTAHSDLESAVTSYQTGAFEYLPKPFDVDDAVALVKRAVAHSHEKRAASEPQADYLRRLFRHLSVDLVIDVGANEGQFGTFLRERVGYAGRIASFEPRPMPSSQRSCSACPPIRWTARIISATTAAWKPRNMLWNMGEAIP